jgi:hypothetical protein
MAEAPDRMGYKLSYADPDVWLRPTIKANSFEHTLPTEQYEESARLSI